MRFRTQRGRGTPGHSVDQGSDTGFGRRSDLRLQAVGGLLLPPSPPPPLLARSPSVTNNKKNSHAPEASSPTLTHRSHKVSDRSSESLDQGRGGAKGSGRGRQSPLQVAGWLAGPGLRGSGARCCQGTWVRPGAQSRAGSTRLPLAGSSSGDTSCRSSSPGCPREMRPVALGGLSPRGCRSLTCHCQHVGWPVGP